MKRLVINDKVSEFFFSSETTNDEIIDWVCYKVVMNSGLFGLNEEHSCKADELDSKTIEIMGDEDYMQIVISEVEPIDIK